MLKQFSVCAEVNLQQQLSSFLELKGNCHEQFNLKKTAWTFQVWFKAASMEGKTTGSLAAKEITTDKTADSVNEKWRENLACCHKRLYLNACAAHAWQFPFRPRTHENVFLRFCIVYCSQGNREQPAHYLKQYKNAGKRFRVYGALDSFLKTWKCLVCIHAERGRGVEITLGSENYLFALFCMTNYFVWRLAVVDLKVPISNCTKHVTYTVTGRTVKVAAKP